MTELTFKDVYTEGLSKDAILNESYPGFKEDYLCIHILLKRYGKDFNRFLEIGTHLGEGTQIIKNAIPHCEVMSLDLPAEISYLGNACKLPFVQLRGESLKYDYAQHYPIDGWFIDGEHDYVHVYNDSKQAFNSKAKLIIWHDAETPVVYSGIIAAFNENENNKYKLCRITDTRIVFAIHEKLFMKKPLPGGRKLNRFLQTRAEANEATDELKRFELIPHGLSCKDWDILCILPHIGDGNFCDLGADGSYILQNLVHCGHEGLKYGIDLAFPENPPSPEGITYFKGDLMHTPFDDGLFTTLACLSVVEHQVNYAELAQECARLLAPGGQLFLTCDYWDPKVNTEGMKLYSLNWNILDKSNIINLVDAMGKAGLKITSEIDWTLNEAVITPSYCSPVQGVAYTFGIFHFKKA